MFRKNYYFPPSSTVDSLYQSRRMLRTAKMLASSIWFSQDTVIFLISPVVFIELEFSSQFCGRVVLFY